jgi:SAM-dependent methyltransferase
VSAVDSYAWDPSLYAGSAPHYVAGRMPYPPSLATTIRDELGLDGTGRLLDVGCGPGSLTLLLAPYVAAAVGIDADPDMVRHAAALTPAGANVSWQHLRAEELPAGLGTFRLITFAQSFHWMDQPTVARRVRPMIEPGGAWAHVAASTHRGLEGDDPLPYPRPPWDRIDALVAARLGPVRRAGRSTLPDGLRSGEDDVMRAAGYTGPTRLTVERGETVVRDPDEVVSAVLSLSSSAPHLFGDDLPGFVADLRTLLRSVSPEGLFAERTREIAVTVWRP